MYKLTTTFKDVSRFKKALNEKGVAFHFEEKLTHHYRFYFKEDDRLTVDEIIKKLKIDANVDDYPLTIIPKITKRLLLPLILLLLVICFFAIMFFAYK